MFFGNRTNVGGSWARTGVPQSINTAAYNAANQQTTFGDKTMTFDNNGNLQTITDLNGTTTYTWNARNQLAGISGPGLTASFVYDGSGRREKKTINGNLTEFLYDGLNPVQETSGAAILTNILSGLGIDEFFSRTDVPAGATSHYLSDPLGSAMALTNASGAVQTEYTYEPFGRATVTGSANTNPYQYTGRENDGTGLYYYRARQYHPSLQRFVSEDPVGFGGGDVNLFGYVRNNPVLYSDPLGLWYFVAGGGYSGIVGISGTERSAGFYYDNNTGSVGAFESVGKGGGGNVSFDLFGGLILGELDGYSRNFNASFGPISVTILTDGNWGATGFTIGLNPIEFPPGASITDSETDSVCVWNCRVLYRAKKKSKSG